VLGTGKALLKVCPWLLLLSEGKILKSVLQNQNHKGKENKRKKQGICKLNCTSISSVGQESDNFLYIINQSSR